MCSEHPTVPARECDPCQKKHKRPPWFRDMFRNEAEKDAERRRVLKEEQDAAAAAALEKQQLRSMS